MKNISKQITSSFMAFLVGFGAPLAGCSRIVANNQILLSNYRSAASTDSDDDGGDTVQVGDLSFPKGDQQGTCTNCTSETKEGDTITVDMDGDTWGQGPATKNENGGWTIERPTFGCTGGTCTDGRGGFWQDDRSGKGTTRAPVASVRPYQKDSSNSDSASNGNSKGNSAGGDASNANNRIDRNDTPSTHDYASIEDLEREVVAERASLGKSAAALVDELTTSGVGLGDGVEKAKTAHNAFVNSIVAKKATTIITGAKTNKAKFETPAGTELGQSIRNAEFSANFVGAQTSADGELAIEIADTIIHDADARAAAGDVVGAQKRLQSAQKLVDAARNSGLIPQKTLGYDAGHFSAPDTQRYAAYTSSLNLFASASELDKSGLNNLAQSLHNAATPLLNIGLGLARFTALVDIPASIVEAFTGNSVEFNANGDAVLREASLLERSFAVGTIVLAGAGFAAGGWAAALGVGVVAGIGKAIEKQTALHVGKEGPRLAGIEQRAGVADGALSKALSHNPHEVADAIKQMDNIAGDVVKNGISKTEGLKTTFWKSGVSKEAEGIAVIKYEDKIQSIMPMKKKDFEKL